VSVKIRYRDFQTISRARTLGAPTDEAATIWAVAERLLRDALAERTAPIRLLGVGASGLVDAGQLALFR
jgi:DNA polymerase-4